MKKSLGIAKYRKEYESVIINLDDYVGMLMIKQSLNMKPAGDIKSNLDAINALNILK